jgi:hypothetical protein
MATAADRPSRRVMTLRSRVTPPPLRHGTAASAAKCTVPSWTETWSGLMTAAQVERVGDGDTGTIGQVQV